MPHAYHPLLTALAGQASTLNNRPRRLCSLTRWAVCSVAGAALGLLIVARSVRP